MAFKVVKSLTVKWRVDIEQPTDNNKTEKFDFLATFKILSEEDYKKMAESSKDDREFISKFLVGWEDLVDENDKPLEYSKANVLSLASLAFVRSGIFKAYHAAAGGIGDPEIKN